MAQTNCPFNWLYNTTLKRVCQLNRSACTRHIFKMTVNAIRVQFLCLGLAFSDFQYVTYHSSLANQLNTNQILFIDKCSLLRFASKIVFALQIFTTRQIVLGKRKFNNENDWIRANGLSLAYHGYLFVRALGRKTEGTQAHCFFGACNISSFLLYRIIVDKRRSYMLLLVIYRRCGRKWKI